MKSLPQLLSTTKTQGQQKTFLPEPFSPNSQIIVQYHPNYIVSKIGSHMSLRDISEELCPSHIPEIELLPDLPRPDPVHWRDTSVHVDSC
jgi:hypothetical protein